ncbi:hypothetical protein COHA_005541 [Chlorella ohadii]|uniref:Rieske domain-containing protein n=1 Tax=Chlorella ohadii TaxID=2649997 RepID=A0AAD5H597_9CHLO|nr:hypothetical protein COHA_005541 [Chlorella ohadii]
MRAAATPAAGALSPTARLAALPRRHVFAGARIPQSTHAHTGRRPAARRCARTAPPSAQLAAPEVAAAEEASRGRVDWFGTWWPVAFVRDIPDKEPYSFKLLDQPIVIWRDQQGTYRCFYDACPHRLVPLSDGRITPDGKLECPYHGWQFKGCGTCTSMPQGGDPSAPRSSATAFQCAVKQDMVWVKLQPAPADGSEPDTSGIRIIPELEEEGWFAFGDMWRDIPYDWATLIENVIDAGHVPFTHHGSVSKRQTSGDYDLRVTERGDWGFRGVWEQGPRRGKLGAQHTLWDAPVLMRHTIDSMDKSGFANITAVYGVPMSAGRCRALVRQPFKFKNKLIPLLFKVLPEWRSHLGNNSVLDEDVIFLHMQASGYQEREAALRGMGDKPAGQVYYMPAASDAYVAGFRAWLNKTAGGGPWGPMDDRYLLRAGRRLPEKQLLDHYHSHTERCSICRPALRNLRVARAAAAAVGIAAAAVAAVSLFVQYVAPAAAAAPAAAGQAAARQVTAAAAAASPAGCPPLVALAAACAAVAAVAGLVWRWCHRTIPQFYTGERPFARNRVPGEFAPQI